MNRVELRFLIEAAFTAGRPDFARVLSTAWLTTAPGDLGIRFYLAKALAANIDIQLTDEHMRAIRFLRADYKETGQTPTLRRVTNVGGIPTRELFDLFPKKPAKKMAYIAGLTKPAGCV